MVTIRLYWNNICILHRQELAFLDQIKEQLLTKGIDLQVTCFGLGYSRHMSDYLMEPDSELPDMVVSADLEVFEDSRIFSRFLGGGLHPLASLLPVKETESVPLLRRGPSLLPYLAIPLVFYADSLAFPDGSPLSLDSVLENGCNLTFGGIHNSAAKSVVKTVWASHGKEAAARLLSEAIVTEMPIQAFQRVRTGQDLLALVPSVYAFRADGRTHRFLFPSDGAVAIPSYICARSQAPVEAVLAVAQALRAPQISRFYVENGCLVCCAPDSPAEPLMARAGGTLRLPSPEFLSRLSPEEFYQVYQVLEKKIPAAG